ncbi:mitotic and meiotic (sporulation) septin Spn2 [Schizosaccharomyces pombe]|uniref:Septin homolog spn2 n=1 Tax=Schizosaccharomyces pombe (strain 972 / ATCC 24843) TaxID=284812 RepID=SPN2_SCHPO|nr:septin Spn2 [Schizosaccharomyces pombe]Q09116.2 RecName: Full=Septin homolog spn2 [Schizosaccharomyces pombe 972h-]AAB53690.2 septin homolog [Schizosaccharomyces pombe]CAB57440.1 septin Spn2 [Schizosaccharomyces pombe]|eukprot:NP_593159.1 septin Spn2 [Schizosaccharomyces pombe]
MEVPSAVTLNNYVGFDSITSQINRKLIRRGFQFNVMVVGPSGSGKSTLINTLFSAHLMDSKGRLDYQAPYRQTTEIHVTSQVVRENRVQLQLNLIDTPGYGDQINNDKCWEPIIKYIRDQHSSYLRRELNSHREKRLQDTRVHCCLFFIRPTGHSLRPIDIAVLKRLTEVVNVVPVIAKSDSLTLEERAAFKQQIREEFVKHDINLYPYDSDDADEEEINLNAAVRNLIPFAVVGSEKAIIVDGRPIRGRQNRWGVVNVDDENHCEFVFLRNFLMRTHLQDLIETTSYYHYEKFRFKQLSSLKEQSSLATRMGSPAPVYPSEPHLHTATAQ